jgi:Domain of unknown function (DUF6362)
VENWTVEQVEMRLDEAASVLRKLPAVRVPGYFNTWPTMVVEFADRVGREPEPMKLPPPSPAAITQLEQTLDWLHWLEAEDAKLVWARSEGRPWKHICFQFGIPRATANRRWQYALHLIAWRLNGRAVPTKRSRGFLLERARDASSQIGTVRNLVCEAMMMGSEGASHGDREGLA